MELSEITPKKHERTFSMLSGLTVGLFILLLFNLSGHGPEKFVIMFLNTSFFTMAALSHYLESILFFSLAIIAAGTVTSILLSKTKRNSMLGGFTGIILILVIMLTSYLYGTIDFPTSSQVITILGPASIPLVFMMYAIPITMVGFIFGYLGSFLVEKFYYNQTTL